MHPAPMQRNAYIDGLRVITTLIVLVFHCARFFDHEGWHVKNPDLHVGMDILVGVMVLWIMPVFFVLSGFGSFYSLQGRKNSSYLKARVKRLLVPFLFGTLVLIPPQVYIERVSHGRYTGSFIDFFPLYFDGWYGFGGNFAWMGLHLWYLEVLFLFSLVTLGLFHRLKKPLPPEADPGIWQRSGALLAWFLPLFAVQLLVNLQPGGIGRRDFGGWSVLVYLVFYILGFMLARDARIRASLLKSRWIALLTGFAATGVLLYDAYISAFIQQLGPSLEYGVRSGLRPLAAWSWVLGLLGFALRYVSTSNGFLKYANQAVLPFYILHQTVIVIIAFWMIDWDAGIVVKFVTLLSASFVIIMVLYEGLIRRIPSLGWLFGMRKNR